jgi:hypothetical protein
MANPVLDKEELAKANACFRSGGLLMSPPGQWGVVQGESWQENEGGQGEPALPFRQIEKKRRGSAE